MANLMGSARVTGMLGGIANVFGSQGGRQAVGRLFQSEEQRLMGRVKAEGSLAKVTQDLAKLADFSLPTARLMVNSDAFYNANPAGKELLLKQLDTLGGVGADIAGISEKELKDFRSNQAKTIIDRLVAMQQYGIPEAGPVRKELESPLAARYRTEGFPERKLPTPTGFAEWAPETRTKFFQAAGTPGGPAMTAPEAGAARVGGRPLGPPTLKPAGRVAGFLLEQDVNFKTLTATDKPLIALLASGSEAMVRAMEMTGATYEELEKKFPILRDKAALKKHLGMDDMRNYDSVAIEGESPEKRLETLAWLIRASELSDESLRWLINNWLFADLPEPLWWKEATPRPTGGLPPIGGGLPAVPGAATAPGVTEMRGFRGR